MLLTIFLIIAILIAGYFISNAIRNNTQVNAAIELQKNQRVLAKQQQKLDEKVEKERQAEHKQWFVSYMYFEHLATIQRYTIDLVQHEIDYLSPPKEYEGSWHYEGGFWIEELIKTYPYSDKTTIKKVLKLEIQSAKDSIEHWNNEWKNSFKDDNKFYGYRPESLETIKSKYNLETFSMYEEGSVKLRELENELKQLRKQLI